MIIPFNPVKNEEELLTTKTQYRRGDILVPFNPENDPKYKTIIYEPQERKDGFALAAGILPTNTDLGDVPMSGIRFNPDTNELYMDVTVITPKGLAIVRYYFDLIHWYSEFHYPILHNFIS